MSVASRSIVGRWDSSVERDAAGTRATHRAVIAARPASIPANCAGVNRSAIPAKVRDAQHPDPRGEQPEDRIFSQRVQPGHEILPGQLRARQPQQHLVGLRPAGALLHRWDIRAQHLDHVELAAHQVHRGQARVTGQRRVRLTHGEVLATPPGRG